MIRHQHKPTREPRTLAQQLQPDTIECMACEQIKPAAGSRQPAIPRLDRLRRLHQ